MELEVSPGVYGAPEDDSYGVDFAAETLNQAYPGWYGLIPGCGRPYGGLLWRKGHSKEGLLHEQGIQASQAIASIPTWMGCPATWRVKCVSVAEANEIVTACKRLERENWRRARGSFSTGSPPCDWVPHYRQSPNHSSLRQPRVRC